MIYTVTLNPALDYAVRVENFRQGATNRTAGETLAPGGKGINVAVVLRNLGVPARALGFAAGFTGDAILGMLRDRGVETDMVRIPGLSRINIKLKAERETEINGRGADITAEAWKALTEKLRAIPDGSYLVLAGAVPPSLPPNTYERILDMLRDRKIATAVDATGELLAKVLPYRPYLVKPNHHELGELFGTELTEREEIFYYARKLRETGARNVIVSMAGDGALMVTERGEEFFTPPPQGEVVDSVGAGDSLVAGFLAAKTQGADDYRAFLQGVAAGSATAFRQGLATEDDMLALLAQLDESSLSSESGIR